jgi:nucleoside-diphosphate-sugar epimerase
MKILITGASGYLGHALHARLVESGRHELRVAARVSSPLLEAQKGVFLVSDFCSEDAWISALDGVDVVVHLAARVHVFRDKALDPFASFRRVNVDASISLAKQALRAGVKRFVFVSSVGVNGTQTNNVPFSENSVPSPQNGYALSKFEAENALCELTSRSEMELVIIRPPLVYSASAPGNFARLLRLVKSGIPLPFGCVRNQRSMIALENLVDFLNVCIEHPAAARQTFLVSDGTEISTPQMVSFLAQGMGRRPCLIPVPLELMRVAATWLGRREAYTQLCGSLIIDSSKARRLLHWTPPLTPAVALIASGYNYCNKT